ncbi:hypothetical protein CC1G_12460 [Coprinopsis cinerea okayama7|uniref:Uncharacterized protein n=1 Tax=Coprinopsis cinerea (strain Okayama-7 / 130 / ATCC MYA-4618 / FGSC 9003) TaxID=240176 RepID=A8NL00_COPC7|nr:hypothetical protein CC1G_12460 [Coprinopsis cinerea okayama7\|eukprot:XP_001834582.2 hypothetical protein CC1G_12460 [Coprinopsis cinerea okayama7\
MSTTPTSSPRPSKWSRVGAAMRRSTTLLVPTSRPTTPAPADRDSDSVSITKQKVDTTPATLAQHPSSSAVPNIPSPVPETPREHLPMDAPLGPSPLAKEASTRSEAPVVDEPEAVSPQGYVPPPLIDSSTGNPGAFTDDADLLPQPEVAVDPFASSSRVDLSSASKKSEDKDKGPQFVDEPESLKDESIEESTSKKDDKKPQVDEPKPFFDKPFVSGVDEDSHRDFAAAVEENTVLSPPGDPAPFTPKFVPQVLVPQAPTNASTDSFSPMLPSHHEHDEATAPVTSSPAPIFTMPSHDYVFGHDVWGGKQPEVPRSMPEPSGTNGNADVRDRSQPFSTQPQHSPNTQQPPVFTTQEDVKPNVSMPLPSFNDVIPPKRVQQEPSTSSFIYDRAPVDTDETRPLLGVGSSRGPTYMQGDSSNILDVSPLASTNGNAAPWVPSVPGSVPAPRLHELGWLEYHLPDGTFYYVHPTRKIITDLNLRLDKVLTDVTNFLENGSGSGFGAIPRITGKDVATPGMEIWLRDVGNKKGFIPVKCYVDHHARTVTVDRIVDGGRGKKVVDEDQLDMEFRYWSFMEAHPAHTTLPAKAKAEAMDVLTWAWTDRLLPSHRSVPAPFGQEECQELMNLLRGYNPDNHDDHGIQNRIVSRILLRVAVWRQKYFRPNKPLPKDVSSNQLHLPAPRRGFPRAFFDLVISIICLGLPYLFIDRSRIGGRSDEEHGTLGSPMRSHGAILIMGGCACLMAAIVLSASVTFLALPGLESISRTAALVAILFSSFSMASTLVAVFKAKSDVERAVGVIGLEGVTNISKRAFVLSLPLVFLAYSIISFIVGITVYSLRGGSLFNPNVEIRPFEDYTKWTVMGLVGAFGGILATSYFLARR